MGSGRYTQPRERESHSQLWNSNLETVVRKQLLEVGPGSVVSFLGDATDKEARSSVNETCVLCTFGGKVRLLELVEHVFQSVPAM